MRCDEHDIIVPTYGAISKTSMASRKLEHDDQSKPDHQRWLLSESAVRAIFHGHCTSHVYYWPPIVSQISSV